MYSNWQCKSQRVWVSIHSLASEHQCFIFQILNSKCFGKPLPGSRLLQCCSKDPPENFHNHNSPKRPFKGYKWSEIGWKWPKLQHQKQNRLKIGWNSYQKTTRQKTRRTLSLMTTHSCVHTYHLLVSKQQGEASCTIMKFWSFYMLLKFSLLQKKTCAKHKHGWSLFYGWNKPNTRTTSIILSGWQCTTKHRRKSMSTNKKLPLGRTVTMSGEALTCFNACKWKYMMAF